MSDTPRTDTAWNKGFDPVILSAAQLARRLREQCAALERENAGLQKQLEQWKQSTEWFAEWAEKKQELERENAGLRKDKERLDWIIGKAHYLFFKELGSDLAKGRQQIDAARKEAQP